MVELSTLEAHPTSAMAYHKDFIAGVEMTNHRHYISQESGALPPMPKRPSRRKRRGTKIDALQELDQAVASLSSQHADTSDSNWNDGDSISLSSHSVAGHDAVVKSTSHRDLIANMRDFKEMRGRSLPSPYVVGSRSVSSRFSRTSSRASYRSRKSSSQRKREELDRMIGITLLETASSIDAESHFLPQDMPCESMVSTDDILHDLVTTSTLVEQTALLPSPPPSTSADCQFHQYPDPEPLLTVPSSESGDDTLRDNFDLATPTPTKPIFFKLQKQARQTIPEETSPRNHSSPVVRDDSPIRWRVNSSQPHEPETRPAVDPPSIDPRELFAEPVLTEDGFPAQPLDTPQGGRSVTSWSMLPTKKESTPRGSSVVRARMDPPTSIPDNWQSEWTTFDTSPFGSSNGSPSSTVIDPFQASIRATLSNDSGSKYSI